MAFVLNSYPVIYRAKYKDNKGWQGSYIVKPHKTPQEEYTLEKKEKDALINARNFFDDMPIVNYSVQYGLSCFEGLKAFPQKNGGLALFRPEKNAHRFYKSMEGLYMPPFPEKEFLKACIETIKQNTELGFFTKFNDQWEKDSFKNADSIYLRPLTVAEGGVGLNISREPWVMIVTLPVSSYFSVDSFDAVVTDRIRATPKGTGWIKSASNYVISTLAKYEAQKEGFVEAIYLDSTHRKYVEEGSSSNIFFLLKSGELVTPELSDTILGGITRLSIIELAKDKNLNVKERKISIDEVISGGKECFVCGTAAGITPINSITYQGKKIILNNNKTGEFTFEMQNTLKGIQYGVLPDTKNWLVKI